MTPVDSALDLDARTSLLQTLRRANVRVATISMVAVGLALSVAAFIALRVYADQNLHLIARTIAYTVEAAVVFRDEAAVQELLDMIARRESLSSARLVDSSGKLLASYEREQNKPAEPASLSRHIDRALAATGDGLTVVLLQKPVSAPILYQGKEIGMVTLRGDGAGFVLFALTGLGGTLLCMVLVALGVRQISRRIQRDILEPVHALTTMTHRLRFQHTSTHRAPPSQIAEFHQLGEDFNALLAEIESQQARLDQENKSLSHLANHDSLTGLPNRAVFQRRLARVLQDAQSQGNGIGVLYLDNDHFKQINDQFGHAVGDLLLVEVAQRVRAQLREGDLVARLGGDEFAVLLAPVLHPDDAMRIAHKISSSMKEPLPTRKQDRIVPSLSIGIALYPQHGQTADQLLRAADRAMYRAKRAQRGNSVMFDADRDTTDFRDSSL